MIDPDLPRIKKETLHTVLAMSHGAYLLAADEIHTHYIYIVCWYKTLYQVEPVV